MTRFFLSPKEMFTQVYNGQKNFMTPIIVKYLSKTNKRKTHRIAFEISEGRSFNRESFYGCTVLLYNNKNKKTSKMEEFNMSSHDYQEIINHVNEKKKEFSQMY